MALARCAGSSRRFTQVFGSFSSSQATSIAPATRSVETGATTLAAADIRRRVQTTERAVLMAVSPCKWATLRADGTGGRSLPSTDDHAFGQELSLRKASKVPAIEHREGRGV